MKLELIFRILLTALLVLCVVSFIYRCARNWREKRHLMSLVTFLVALVMWNSAVQNGMGLRRIDYFDYLAVVIFVPWLIFNIYKAVRR